MKQLLELAACVLATGIVLFISCKKELSCENCNVNQLPIANAGRDTVITLPKDSVILDGTASTDPDGTITSYKWAKIAGPVSANISKPNSSKTFVKSLVADVYKFELTVTDNGGLSAKDTVQVLVAETSTGNKPPIANAGPDQEIGLPVNTSTLDGSGSTDPENNITAYNWTMISGPSGTITDPNSIQTQLTGLEPGIYLFELKVGDAGGLFSKDTIEVKVFACDNSNRPYVNVQLIPIGTLSQKRDGMAVASAGDKILFAGALQSLENGAVVSNYGSSNVDIYNIVTKSWATARLSESRSDIAAVAAGNKIFFAGGKLGDGAPDQLFSTIDVYDASANTWSKTSLSEPRSYIAAATAGNKVFFAGGNLDEWNTKSSDRVDVYNLTYNSWSTMRLSQPREGISAVTANNKVYFVGGLSRSGWANQFYSNRIDIYDNATDSWATSSLMESKWGVAAVTTNNRIYLAGGVKGKGSLNSSCLVEIRDVNSGNSSVDYLFRPAQFYINRGENGVVRNNKIVFYKSSNNKFDIYDITSNSWSIGLLPINLTSASIISVNNTIYLAGGRINGVLSDKAWKMEF